MGSCNKDHLISRVCTEETGSRTEGKRASRWFVCRQVSIRSTHSRVLMPLEKIATFSGLRTKYLPPGPHNRKKLLRKSAELIKETDAKMFSKEDERRESTCSRGLDWFVEETQRRGWAASDGVSPPILQDVAAARWFGLVPAPCWVKARVELATFVHFFSPV